MLPRVRMTDAPACSRFQSSPGPEAGCCRDCEVHLRRRPRCFNPHPARRPGAARAGGGQVRRRLQVSILTRPGGRVLLGVISSTSSSHASFQSSPGPEAGCCAAPTRTRGVLDLHVSILTRPGGRVLHLREHPARLSLPLVSILTRPGGRVLRGVGPGVEAHRRVVSILTRPGGRVLPSSARPRRLSWTMFQSSPGPEAGCCLRGRGLQPRVSDGFNPHPARRPGAADRGGGAPHSPRGVSILTRPGGRVLLARIEDQLVPLEFQSSPGPEAGCCPPSRRSVPSPSSFNPHPARRPGAAAIPCGQRLQPLAVSILTRPGGRVLPRREAKRTTRP